MLHTLRTQSEVARELSENDRQTAIASDYLEALKCYEPMNRYVPTISDLKIQKLIEGTEQGIKRLHRNRRILLQMQSDHKHSEELKLYNFIT